MSWLGTLCRFYLSRFNYFILLLICLVIAGMPFCFFLLGLLSYDFSFDAFQPVFNAWLWHNLWSTFGFDGISLLLMLLVLFVFPIYFFAITFYNLTSSRLYFFFILIVLELILLCVFSFSNMLLFYISFEATLIPMFILIGYFGARYRKIKAAYYLFFYTFIGSIFMLICLLSLYFLTGSLSFYVVFHVSYTLVFQKVLWVLLFLTFAVKIPMVPFHIWLPEAHVEAPTTGSIILASILLKLGGYGFIRFSLGLIPAACLYFMPLVFTISLCGIVFASLSTLRQIDIKRIIAYSSIAHMNMAVLGLFLNNIYGLFGAVYLMLGHGLISSGLFFSIGVLYDRYHTRLLFYYGGLTAVMPLYAFCFLFLSFANIGFPGTFNFISELHIFLGVFKTSALLLFFAFIGFVFTVIYSIWLYNRMMFGTLKINYLFSFSDVNFFEFGVFILLIVFCLFFGFSTSFVVNFIHNWSVFLYVF